ncbi:MAG TPA: hypothetical protein VGI61_11090 [Parafilimonas sp.]
MNEKGLYYPVVRRIITIIVLLIVAGSFLAVYYLVYLPQEHSLYNLRNFRVLHEITENFQTRVENYGTGFIYIKNKKDPAIPSSLLNLNDNEKLNELHSSFKGNASANDSLHSRETIKADTVVYQHINKQNIKYSRDTAVSLSEIMDPITSIHSDIFESFLLVKQIIGDTDKYYDPILYESGKSDIANINIDSVCKSQSIENPAISDFNIEGIAYKMYLVPFKIKSETFVIAGIVSYDTYRDQSQSVPVSLLLSVCFVLIIVLVALPFLKIFFLSAEENIKINDVRATIAVIFIIPFFATLISAGIWLSLDSDKASTEVLSSLQNNIQNNFYSEISESIKQAKSYDAIVSNSDTLKKLLHADSAIIDSIKKIKSKDAFDLKDIIFYPEYYKKLTSLHWMDSSGHDIAAWNLNKLPPSYFNVADRQYFKDIRYNRGYLLPDSCLPCAKDTFALQPVLSRLTGEYTVNLVIRSNAQFANNKNAAAVGLSSKMYSIYNTVMPNGFSYCIIDEQGNIMCHSNAARNLQENIFEESSDSFALRSIIKHKDSVLIKDIDLYEQPVKLIIKPLKSTPYYLITYYDKQGDYLFIFHILAFVFICEATLLVFVSIFSYFMMLSSKKNSKLFFTYSTLTWLRPSPDKKIFYIKNFLQLIAILVFTGLMYLFFIGDNNNLYLLNAALLIPLFTVTGYCIIKKAKTFIEKESKKELYNKEELFNKNEWFNKQQYWKFFRSLRSIFLLYIASVAVFEILQNVLFFNQVCAHEIALRVALLILIILIPFITSFIAVINFDYKNSKAENSKIEKPNAENYKADDISYLKYFIISLLLAVLLTSVIPTLIFTSYGFKEEKILRLQSLQIDLARKIQQRRLDVNPQLWLTKLSINKNDTSNYINDLKFNKRKGIYLLNNDDRIDTTLKFNSDLSNITDCSPFYKHITQYIFLPPDHDEFYNDKTHEDYYYWKTLNKQKDTAVLQLNYNNKTDNHGPASFTLSSAFSKPYFIEGITGNYIGWILLFSLIVFVMIFYKVIYAVCVRIFLIGFFEDVNEHAGKKPDTELEKQEHTHPDLLKDLKALLGINKPVNFKIIHDIENKKVCDDDDADGFIIELHLMLNDVYERIWDSCTEAQKYTLYNFATDGFTNYKKVLILHKLYKEGLLVKETDGNVELLTKSFRNFLITKEMAPEIKKLSSLDKKGSWSSLRTFFYIILIAVAIFIFLSQEEASKRIIAIITSLGAVIPVMLKLFDKSTTSAAAPSKNN